MPRDILSLSWKEFDVAIGCIAERAQDCKAVYGEPRGGLVLAVALSHELRIPLITDRSKCGDGLLWVDDIVDTGRTLFHAQTLMPHRCASWVTRGVYGVIAPISLNDDRWVLFPWEVIDNAQEDADDYSSQRNL